MNRSTNNRPTPDAFFEDDEMDELLYSLPGETPAWDLAQRICQSIQTRRRRTVRLHMAASLLMAAFGLWLAVPNLTLRYQQIDLPDSGLPLLFALIDAVWIGLEDLALNTLNGLLSFTAGSFVPFDALTWLGMIALAAGALLAVGYLLPQTEQ